jgi:hypothetical protein
VCVFSKTFFYSPSDFFLAHRDCRAASSFVVCFLQSYQFTYFSYYLYTSSIGLFSFSSSSVFLMLVIKKIYFFGILFFFFLYFCLFVFFTVIFFLFLNVVCSIVSNTTHYTIYSYKYLIKIK